jgi:hypothetical protein
MTESRIAFVELDQQLARDHGGAALQRLRQRMLTNREKCRSALRAGLAAQDAKHVEAIMSAYDAASALLPVLWRAQQSLQQP